MALREGLQTKLLVCLGHTSVFIADLADSSCYTVPQFPHSLIFQNLYVLKLSFSDHGFFEIAGQLSGITLQTVNMVGWDSSASPRCHDWHGS